MARGSKGGQDRRLKLGYVPPAAKEPKLGKVPDRKKFAFSLKYWRQIDLFGIGQVQKTWFTSLLVRLKELSDIDVEEVQKGTSNISNKIRFHPIDWDARNIPITRSDLTWLDGVLSDEFELYQFHVSTALGRVIGFFDQLSVFQVVLLDPLHNLQPSGTFDYRVRQTHIAECQISSLKARITRFICDFDSISIQQKQCLLAEIENQTVSVVGSALLVEIDEKTIDILVKALAGGLAKNGQDIIELGAAELKRLLEG